MDLFVFGTLLDLNFPSGNFQSCTAVTFPIFQKRCQAKKMVEKIRSPDLLDICFIFHNPGT